MDSSFRYLSFFKKSSISSLLINLFQLVLIYRTIHCIRDRGMSKKHQQVRQAIFKILIYQMWYEKYCEKLLISLGAEISKGAEGLGLHCLNGVKVNFHCPIMQRNG